MIFGISYQVNLTGSGLFKWDRCRNSFINIIKNAKKSFFINKKFNNTESAQLCKINKK